MATTQPVDIPPPAVAATGDATATNAASPNAAPVMKKRRVERRERLRKSAICKHFDKPGGCPFPDCKFAHGRTEIADAGKHSVAAQRKLIREQAVHRTEEQFQTAEAGAVTSTRRGTMIERYYTEMFSCDTMGKPLEDQYVHMHSNRLCVVGVAASHPVMQEELESVEFAQHILDSRVTGKKKKGGRFLLPNTALCVLKCKSGREFTLFSCIRGSLIEVNERLQSQPTLLQQKHQSDGYLVIIQPKKVEVAEIQESLLSKDEYKHFCALPRPVEVPEVAVVSEELSADTADPSAAASAPQSAEQPQAFVAKAEAMEE